MRNSGLLMVALSFTALLGCEASGDHLFPAAIDGVPGIIHIEAEGGGPFTPAVITTREDVEAATVYTELGPTGSVLRSGATAEFVGTGGTVCAYVDPEMVFWGQTISNTGERRWRQPDNVFDDGDIDMQIGASLYYRGTLSEEMGGFEVEFADGLGNEVEVELVACRNYTEVSGNENFDAHAGRATAEYCSIENTQPGVLYTIAMEAFSIPIDDLRLGMGMLIADGPCTGGLDLDENGSADGLINRISPVDSQDPLLVNEECVIRGEGIKPKSEGAEVWYGYDAGRTWTGSVELEDTFCDVEQSMTAYCNAERISNETEGVTCSRFETGPDTPDEERCYCGDRFDTPSGGAAEF